MKIFINFIDLVVVSFFAIFVIVLFVSIKISDIKTKRDKKRRPNSYE